MEIANLRTPKMRVQDALDEPQSTGWDALKLHGSITDSSLMLHRVFVNYLKVPHWSEPDAHFKPLRKCVAYEEGTLCLIITSYFCSN